jgi:hypothetical protein
MRYKDGYLACDELHGCLHSANCMIPHAYPYGYRTFYIDQYHLHGTLWRYVPHKHSGAGNRRPSRGEKVAMVYVRGRWEPRAFQPAKAPRVMRCASASGSSAT